MRKKNLNFKHVFFCLLMLPTIHAYANELKLHIIRAPGKISWNSVNGMLVTSFMNTLGSKPKSSYAIGHFAVEIKCDSANEYGVSHFLTGMSRSDAKAANEHIRNSGMGLGALVYPFEGTLDSSSMLIDDFKVMNELERYQSIAIPTTAKRCQQMLSFMNAWIENASYSVYGGGKDVASGEGSGCADFAERFYEIATGRKFPDSWVVERKIPLKLIGNKENKVSLLRVLFRHDWAKENEDFIPYRIPDPTVAFDELKAGFDLSKIKIVSDQVSENNVQFKFKYSTDKKAREIWDKIKLTSSH